MNDRVSAASFVNAVQSVFNEVKEEFRNQGIASSLIKEAWKGWKYNQNIEESRKMKTIFYSLNN